MLVGELIGNIATEEIKGDICREVDYISLNSKETNEKTAFIAIKGFVTDGHKYIDNAIDNNCKVIFHQEKLKEYKRDITYIRLVDTRVALADLSSALFYNPSKELSVIGITGTNGKTTTTYMLEEILNYNNSETASIGSIGLKTLKYEKYLGNTTPESNLLQKIFRDLINEKVKNVVMEVSSHALDLNRVRNVEFDYGIFTNLTLEHLELHKDMESYYNAKKKLFYLVNKSSFINIDDIYGKRLEEELKENGKKIFTYGIDKEADYMAKDIDLGISDSKFKFISPKGEKNITMPISAKFNIYNAIAAMAVACEMGLSLDQIEMGIKNFKGPEGRYEIVKNQHGLNLIVDFAHTPDAVEKILESAKTEFKKEIIVLFGVQGARTIETREAIGEVVGKFADFSIVTQDDELFDTVENISKSIIKGIEKYSDNYITIGDRRKAIRYAVKMANKDNIVLFLGKGSERFLKKDGEETYYHEIEEINKALKEIE